MIFEVIFSLGTQLVRNYCIFTPSSIFSNKLFSMYPAFLPLLCLIYSRYSFLPSHPPLTVFHIIVTAIHGIHAPPSRTAPLTTKYPHDEIVWKVSNIVSLFGTPMEKPREEIP